MLPPTLLVIDPGGMTGMASLSLARDFSVGEFAFQEACSRIWTACEYNRGRMWILWERWHVFADTHKKTPQLDAPEVIGVARFAAQHWGCRILPPAQQHTPDRTDQARLKLLGWWLPGKNDAQSAAAHLLNWLMRSNELPPRERQLIMEAAQ
jgi:hypothetical protein